MKKFIYTTLILFISSFIWSQESLLNFKEHDALMDGSKANVGTIKVKGEMKEVKKAWQTYVKENVGESMNEGKTVFILKETVVHQISDKRGDLLAYIFPDDGMISLNVAYKMGYDIYLNSEKYPEEFNKLEKFMNGFIYSYYEAYLPKVIKKDAKNLKKIENESRKAQKIVQSKTRRNNSLKRKMRMHERKSDRLQKSILTLEDEAKIASKKATIEKLKTSDEAALLEIKKNEGLIKSNASIVETLKPKQEELIKEISAAKLTLSEIRAKMKGM